MTPALAPLAAALTALWRLLDDPAVQEDSYQEWFVEHPIVFEALGYQEAIPHPQLVREKQPPLIPDFLCRRSNGLWEIVELKVSDQPIVRSPDRRPRFYAPVAEYVSQCREYAEYFREAVNRSWVKEHYDIDVQDIVPALLVVGRLAREDPRKINKLVTDLAAGITITPYDEIAMNLELLSTQLVDHTEGGSGFSAQLVLALRELRDEDNVILDMALAPDRDRFTLFVSPGGELKLRLLDHDGTVYWVSDSLDDLGIEYDQIVLLGLQIGFGADSSVVTLEVDGVTRTTRVFDPVRLDTNASALIWGSDVSNRGVGSFRLYATAGWGEVLGLADRRSVYDELKVEEKRAIANTGSLPSHFDLLPGTCIISADHPLISGLRCAAPEFHPGPDQE